jgi:hypothetical protein
MRADDFCATAVLIFQVCQLFLLFLFQQNHTIHNMITNMNIRVRVPAPWVRGGGGSYVLNRWDGKTILYGGGGGGRGGGGGGVGVHSYIGISPI